MSDVGRYRRAYPRLFRHPEFKKLSPLEQRLTVYILFGPQSNRIGLFYFSLNTAAEDLDTTPETLRKALREVTVAFGWSFDAIARVVFIPSWWRWNPPDHEKVLRGNLKDLHEIPPCGLADKFAANLAYLKPELHETFVEAIRIALPKASGSQYQKQLSESGNQEQKPSALTRGADERITSTIQPKALDVARRTLKLTNPDGPLEELIDAFSNVARSEGLSMFNRADARAALNHALVERRTAS